MTGYETMKLDSTGATTTIEEYISTKEDDLSITNQEKLFTVFGENNITQIKLYMPMQELYQNIIWKINIIAPYADSTATLTDNVVSNTGGFICQSYATTNNTIVYRGATGYFDLTDDSTSNYHVSYISPEQMKREAFKQRLASNLRPNIDAKNGYLMQSNDNPAERRARRLLSDLVSREEFKRYLIRGFIVVKGRSGILYKISGGHGPIISYVKNKEGKYEPFESFCVVFKEWNMPPTDSVIMRKLLVDTDEFRLHQIANVHKVAPQVRRVA